MRWWVCRNRMAGNCDRMREDVKQGGAWCAACLVPWSPATLVRRRGVGLGVSLMCRWEVCVRVSNGGVGRGGAGEGYFGPCMERIAGTINFLLSCQLGGLGEKRTYNWSRVCPYETTVQPTAPQKEATVKDNLPLS